MGKGDSVGIIALCIACLALVFSLGGIVTPSEEEFNPVYLRIDATNDMEGIIYVGVNPTFKVGTFAVNKTTGVAIPVFAYNELMNTNVGGNPAIPFMILGQTSIPMGADISCLNGIFTLPNSPSSPAGVGDCYYNATSNILFIYNGTAWTEH